MSRFKVEISGLATNTLTVLSNQEMKELFQRYQSGEGDVKDLLIKGNLKLVLSLVQRFLYRVENMDDLFQVGCIGLIKAIENFDLKHEVRFSTYAVPMILGEMKRFLRDNQVVRVSRHLKDLSYRVYQEKEAYIHIHQKEPSVEYLAECLQVKVKDVCDALESTQSVLSIFEPMYSQDGDELYLCDQMQDEHNEMDHVSDYMTLQKALEHLKGKEREILLARYFQDKTQIEIAHELGISQAQVSRMEKHAIEQLRKEFQP